jgi:hypothetical protein
MRAWGVFSNADLRDNCQRIAADVRFEPTLLQLANLDDVTEFTLAPAVIAEIASWSLFDIGTRRAIVASADVAYGLARMFSLHAEYVGQNVRVFRDEQAAVDWLNSPTVPGREPHIAPVACGVRIMAA